MGLLSRRRPRPPQPARPSRVGLPAPGLAGVDPQGAPVTVGVEGGSRLVVGFLTSSCRSCRPFWAAVASGSDDPAAPALVVVTPDPATEDRHEVARLRGPGTSTVVMSSASWHAWGVTGSPFFVVVADGTIVAEGWAADWDELLGLIPQG